MKRFLQIHSHLLSRTTSMTTTAGSPISALLLERPPLTKSPLRPRFLETLKEKRSTQRRSREIYGQSRFSFTSLSSASSRAVPRFAPDAPGILVSCSLTLISLPRIDVWRERVEATCPAIQTAPSFLRVGSFKALNSPATILYRRT